MKKIMLTCPGLNLVITVRHPDLSQPVKASFTRSEEVFYRSLITICNQVHNRVGI